ncbi:hypothetical protein ACHAXM_004043 [Skeletonema potamos]
MKRLVAECSQHGYHITNKEHTEPQGTQKSLQPAYINSQYTLHSATYKIIHFFLKISADAQAEMIELNCDVLSE